MPQSKPTRVYLRGSISDPVVIAEQRARRKRELTLEAPIKFIDQDYAARLMKDCNCPIGVATWEIWRQRGGLISLQGVNVACIRLEIYYVAKPSDDIGVDKEVEDSCTYTVYRSPDHPRTLRIKGGL